MTKIQNRLINLVNISSKFMKKIFSTKSVLTALMAIIFVQVVSSGTVFAEDNTTLKGMAEFAGVIINIVTFIALLMMNFFGKLLGTDLLTGEAAMQAITPMWVWVRNLTNILFVIVLVGLAFSNLYSSFAKEGGGNWTIKDKLPKVIIALVAINFSLLGFKVVIDAVNVGTVAILGIADSRLDTDNSNLEGAMLKDKTWMIVSDDMYKKFEDSGEMEELTETSEINGGDSCTKLHNDEMNKQENKDKKVLGFNRDSKNFVCRDFRSSVNDLFCGEWEDIAKDKDGKEKTDIEQSSLNDDCLFILKENKFKTMIDPSDEPGQNLFMSFGTTFVHLERLPALGAKINSLNGVIMNTLFSAIIGLAYLVALIAVFIALIARMVVIWIALVFSPILIAAAIMGFDQGEGGDIASKLVTHLVMPLKIAAAFAVSFVMMSAMIDFNIVGTNEAFVFGPALAHLGIGEFGFLWQIATIVIFWMAAQWAIKGNLLEEHITNKIFSGAQELGTIAARAATVDRQIFSVGTGENKKSFSMSSMMKMPTALGEVNRQHNLKSYTSMQEAFGLKQSDAVKALREKTFTSGGDLMKQIYKFGSLAEAKGNMDEIIASIKNSPNMAGQSEILAAAQKGWDPFVSHMKGKAENIWGLSGESGNLNNADNYGGNVDTNSAKTAEANKVDANSVKESSSEDSMRIGDQDVSAKQIFNGTYKSFDGTTWQMKDIINTLKRSGENVDQTNIDKLISNLKNGNAASIEGVSLDNAEVSLKDNFIAVVEKKDDKAQAVYLANKENNVAYDMSKFGGGKDGKVDASSLDGVLKALADTKKQTEGGITQAEATEMIKYLKTQSFGSSNSEKKKPGNDSTENN